MKTKILYILLTTLLVLNTTQAQKYKMVLCLSNGSTVEHYVDNLDSIIWVIEDNEPSDDEFEEPVTTGDSSNIGVYSATVSAWVNNLTEKDETSTKVGVIYCMDGTPTRRNGKQMTVGFADIDEEGKYDIALSNLAPATIYYYRAFIRLGDTYIYGKVHSFTTEGQGIGFTTGTAMEVTSYSAKIASGMNLSSLEYSTLSYGVCYGTNADPSTDDGAVLGTSRDDDGNYTVNLMALSGDTTYYYRPYAIMDGYVSYGMTSAFRTTGEKVVTTGEINTENFSVASALNMGTGTYRSLTVGVCYSRDSIPTVSDFCVKANEVDDESYYVVTLPLTVDTWYYRAYAIIDGTPHYGDVKMFIVESSDTREAVDLGLSVKWATCNLGATKPSEYGDYFAWGITTGYNESGAPFNWANYGYCDGGYNKLTKYCTSEEYGVKDDMIRLEPDDDAAIINWGAKWRVPTCDEIIELREKCNWKLQAKGNTKYDGVAGYEVTGPNGNTIFLPCAGYRYNSSLRSAGTVGRYWGHCITEANPSNGRCLDFSSGTISDKSRYYGFSIRAVCAE